MRNLPTEINIFHQNHGRSLEHAYLWIPDEMVLGRESIRLLLEDPVRLLGLRHEHPETLSELHRISDLISELEFFERAALVGIFAICSVGLAAVVIAAFIWWT